MRTRAERRKNDYNKAIRKMKICSERYDTPYYDNIHQYSKNKIHCSCPIYSCKTNNKGGYGVSKNYSHSDKIKIESLDSQFEEM